MSRSTFIFLTIVLAAVLLIVGGAFIYSKTLRPNQLLPQTNQKSSLETILVGYKTDPLTSLPFDLAMKKNLFGKEHLKLTSTSSADLTPYLNNDVDFYINKDLASSFVFPKGYRWVASTKRVFPFYLVSQKGKQINRVEVNTKTVDRAYLALAALNYNLSNLKFVDVGSHNQVDNGNSDRYDSIVQNKADATAIVFTNNFFDLNNQLDKDRNEITFDAAKSKDFYYPEVVLASPKLINQRPNLIQPFTQAVQEAINYARNNKDEALAVLTQQDKLSPTQAEAQYQLFLDSTENFDVKPNGQLLNNLFDKIRETTSSAKAFNPNQLINGK